MPAEVVPGDLVADRYEVVEELGRGGMAIVHRARDTVLDREVALKVLAPQRTGDPSFVRRFEREARAIAALNHRNVVAIHDTGEDDGIHYLVMELVDGPTLAEVLAEVGPLPPQQAAAVAHGICGGLAAAHRRGIVHRDVKPSNVVFDTESDTVKVADFGLARSVTSETVSTSVYGSAPYMAPEQARGDDVDPRTDVYAVGCVLQEMLTGRPPFTGDSALAVVAQHQNAQPDLTGLPEELSAIVQRCLRKDPAERYRDAVELVEALEAPAGLVAGAASVSATRVLDTAATTAVAPGETAVVGSDLTASVATGRGRQFLLLGLLTLVGAALLFWALGDGELTPLADGGDGAVTAPETGEGAGPDDGTGAPDDGSVDEEPEPVEERPVDELAAAFVRTVLAGERDGEIDEKAADDLAKRGEEMIKKYREGKLRDVRDEIHDAREDLDEALEKGRISVAAADDLGELLDTIADALGVPRPTPSPVRPSPRP